MHENMNKRTIPQNKSIHLYCELLAEALNNSGLTMQVVLTNYKMDVDWSMASVKEVIWRVAQERMLKKESTTELDTKEVNEVYEVINRFVTQELKMESIPFPNKDVQKYL